MSRTIWLALFCLVGLAPAIAIKIAMDRSIVAGNPGDRDVYGAQQHAPLLELEI